LGRLVFSLDSRATPKADTSSLPLCCDSKLGELAMENSFTYSPGEVAKVRLVQFSILSPDEIEDDKFKLALKIRNPKSRLEQILCACKTKNKCEGDDEIDVLSLLGHDGEEPLRKRKSGCGALQPTLTIDGMNMIAEYKAQRKNNDDQGQLPEPVEGKQTLTAERVLEVLARITDEDCQLLGLNPQYTPPIGGLNDESAEDDVFLEKIENNMLLEMALQGIPHINKVFIKKVKSTKYDDNERFKSEKEFMLDAEGVNLLAVMCHEEVDARRTTSNHLVEIIEVLEIEAVRRVLLHELRAVISFDGSYHNIAFVRAYLTILQPYIAIIQPPLCQPIAPLLLVTAELHQELHQPTALHPKVIILSQPHTDDRWPTHQVVQECHLPVDKSNVQSDINFVFTTISLIFSIKSNIQAYIIP
ncbi:hypothetical protein CUMW_270620, partial [Citrus unshiu]